MEQGLFNRPSIDVNNAERKASASAFMFHDAMVMRLWTNDVITAVGRWCTWSPWRLWRLAAKHLDRKRPPLLVDVCNRLLSPRKMSSCGFPAVFIRRKEDSSLLGINSSIWSSQSIVGKCSAATSKQRDLVAIVLSTSSWGIETLDRDNLSCSRATVAGLWLECGGTIVGVLDCSLLRKWYEKQRLVFLSNEQLLLVLLLLKLQ